MSSDYPLVEIADTLSQLLETNPSAHFFQKFTCEKCGARQTMEKQDRLYTRGICEECGHETNIEKNGCNYVLIL